MDDGTYHRRPMPSAISPQPSPDCGSDRPASPIRRPRSPGTLSQSARNSSDFKRANRQADLPLGRRQLDDLHRVGFADDQLDLLLPCPRARESSNSDTWISPSMPSSSSTNAPKLVMRTTLPSIVSPTWRREKKSSQMSVASCFRPERQPLVLGVDVQHHRARRRRPSSGPRTDA